jgi:predicted component of type VI protein secretion system
LLSGITLDCTVRPILRKEDIRPTQLRSENGNARLGYNTWMLTRMTHEHRNDVAYEVTHHHARNPVPTEPVRTEFESLLARAA